MDRWRRTVLLDLVVVLDRHCGGDFLAIKSKGRSVGRSWVEEMEGRGTRIVVSLSSPELIEVPGPRTRNFLLSSTSR